jgi:hypothetical protein
MTGTKERRPIRRQRHGIDAQTVYVTIPGALAEWLRERARREHVTMSSLISAAVNLYRALKDEENAA